jgi:hypothetical protein
LLLFAVVVFRDYSSTRTALSGLFFFLHRFLPLSLSHTNREEYLHILRDTYRFVCCLCFWTSATSTARCPTISLHQKTNQHRYIYAPYTHTHTHTSTHTKKKCRPKQVRYHLRKAQTQCYKTRICRTTRRISSPPPTRLRLSKNACSTAGQRPLPHIQAIRVVTQLRCRSTLGRPTTSPLRLVTTSRLQRIAVPGSVASPRRNRKRPCSTRRT